MVDGASEGRNTVLVPKRLTVAVILLWLTAGVLLSTAMLPWTQFAGLPKGSSGSVFGVYYGAFPRFLAWPWDHPAEGIVLGATGAAMALGLLAVRPRLRRWAALAAFPLGVVVSVLVAGGNPMPWPWQIPSNGLRLVPTPGYWLAVAALALALASTVLALTTLITPGRARVAPAIPSADPT